MTDSDRLEFDSVDDYLGPSEGRFFSRGYQRADYDVRQVVITPAGTDAGARAVVDIAYPADWSKKKDDVELRPHLSTIDALVLGVQMAEAHLVHTNGLDGAHRRRARLAKVVLRAGNEPQEELTDVPLTATLVRSAPDPSAEDSHRSVYDCVVGGLRVRCEITHPVVRTAEAEAVYDSLTDALGPSPSRFYGEGFKLRRHTIRDVRVEGTRAAEALAAFTPLPGTVEPTDGVDGSWQPGVSLIDCFVVNLQLAQILMYELDGLTREQSNTLWMMQTSIEAAEEPLPLVSGAPLPVVTELTNSRLLPLHGETWRTVGITGSLAGVRMRASFAHALPAMAGLPA